ncbi:MAG: hypothetical protein LC620_03880 [Halobacteriales archaeon]|nr:hypothetical protein [Halobacteriales archaeon]
MVNDVLVLVCQLACDLVPEVPCHGVKITELPEQCHVVPGCVDCIDPAGIGRIASRIDLAVFVECAAGSDRGSDASQQAVVAQGCLGTQSA